MVNAIATRQPLDLNNAQIQTPVGAGNVQAAAVDTGAGNRQSAKDLMSQANQARKSKDFAAAETMYTQAATMFEDLGDRESQANALHKMGRAQAKQGNHDLAVNTYQKAIDIFEILEQPDANASSISGDFNINSGQTTPGEDFSKKLARLYSAKGGSFKAMRDEGGALEAFTQARDHFREIGNQRGEASSLRNIAWANSREGNYADSVDSLKEAADIYENLDDGYLLGSTMNALGNNYHRLGLNDLKTEAYTQAVDQLTQAIPDLESGTKTRRLAWAHHQLGNAHARLDQRGEQVAAFAKAAEYHREAGNTRAEGGATHRMANGLKVLDRKPEAEQAYEKAHELYQEVLPEIQEKASRLPGWKQDLGRIHSNMGAVLNELERPQEANEHLSQAVANFAEDAAPHDVFYLLNRLSDNFDLQGLTQQADLLDQQADFFMDIVRTAQLAFMGDNLLMNSQMFA